jgi:hypothetical protein
LTRTAAMRRAAVEDGSARDALAGRRVAEAGQQLALPFNGKHTQGRVGGCRG